MAQGDDDDDEYKTGYGRPPRHSHFKRGQSGNPKGRPRKDPEIVDGRTIDNIYREFGRKRVPVTINGVKTHLPMLEAIVHTHFSQAMKGNLAAHKVLIKILREVQGPMEISEADISEAIAQLQKRVDSMKAEGSEATGAHIDRILKEPHE